MLTPGIAIGGRYRLVRHIGDGATGAVWEARDIQLDDAPIALKILRPELAKDRQAVDDLKREVLLARRLRHPHIIAVYTFWDVDDVRFITMEYVPGHTLTEKLHARKRPFTVGEALPWLGQLCHALDYAHGAGILHRDIKPANILLDADGGVRLVDFGIARTAQELAQRQDGARTSGTIMFMSPEQLMGEPLDQRSDLYSLASSVYELLSGRTPFQGREIIVQVQMKHPARIEKLPAPVNDVLMQALAKSPADRYPSCGAFFRHFAEAARVCGMSAEEASAAATAADPTLFANHETVALTVFDTSVQHKRLGVLLQEAKVISSEQCAAALLKQRQTGQRLGRILIESGGLTETDLAHGLSSQLRIPLVTANELRNAGDLARVVTRDWAERHLCLPLCRRGDRAVLAMADPLDLTAINELETRAGLPVEPCIAVESDLLAAIAAVFSARTPDSAT